MSKSKNNGQSPSKFILTFRYRRHARYTLESNTIQDLETQNNTKDRIINSVLGNMTSKAVELPAYTIVATLEQLESEISIEAQSIYSKKCIQMLFDMEITQMSRLRTGLNESLLYAEIRT
jgi:hypothetical protein